MWRPANKSIQIGAINRPLRILTQPARIPPVIPPVPRIRDPGDRIRPEALEQTVLRTGEATIKGR
jgi:hypothetical protein